MKRFVILILLLMIFVAPASTYACTAPISGALSLGVAGAASKVTSAFVSVFTKIRLGKSARALPEQEISRLATMSSHKKGLSEVGEELAKLKLPLRYGDEAGDLILQDTYLRIGVKNGRFSQKVADETFELAQTSKPQGLRALIRKINSTCDAQSKGHLRELQIALSAKKRHFEPISFGEHFYDGLKKAPTDLDVLLQRGGKRYAIESKAYAGSVPNDMVMRDADSLLAYCKDKPNTIPVFCFETAPSQLSQELLRSKGIRCLIGDADDIAGLLDLLGPIL